MDPSSSEDHRGTNTREFSSVFTLASRAFASSMHALAAERQRIKEERARILKHEQTTRAEAEEAQQRLTHRMFELQAEERRRISRELHDRVAHTMGVVHQSLELYRKLKESDPEQAEAKLELAQEMAKSALEHTRNLSIALRNSEIEDGLEPVLLSLLRTTLPSEMRHEIFVKGDESLVPPHVRNQLFSILREAIRNAVAHSGCDRVTVELDIAPDRVTGYVEDNGRGFDREEAYSNGRGGLRSMEERTALLGGTFEVSSEPGATRVEVRIPLESTW